MSAVISKKEILSNNDIGSGSLYFNRAMEAMDKYAQQQSVAFAEWLQENRWYTFENGKWEYTFEHGTAMRKESYEKNYIKTTAQLYRLFLDSQSK